MQNPGSSGVKNRVLSDHYLVPTLDSNLPLSAVSGNGRDLLGVVFTLIV